MKLCILVTAENVEKVRETAYANLPEMQGHSLLNFPLSATGQEPITHWFCQIPLTSGLQEKVLPLKELSEMELANSKEFLERKGLKLVRR